MSPSTDFPLEEISTLAVLASGAELFCVGVFVKWMAHILNEILHESRIHPSIRLRYACCLSGLSAVDCPIELHNISF